MANYICKICGYEGSGRRRKSGSGKFELWIWLILPPLGVFYSIWRRIGNRRDCPMCEMPTLVSIGSDEGKIARYKMDVQLGLIQVKKSEEKVEEKKSEGFGNERPAEKITKVPVNPEEW